MIPFVDEQSALRRWVAAAIQASPTMRAPFPSPRSWRHVRRPLGAILVAAVCVSDAVVGQVSTGDRVRIHDSFGVLVVQGRVERITQDSLFLEPMAGLMPFAFSADAFRSDSLWLTVRGSSKVGSTALRWGLGGAVIGGLFGYCSNPGSDECAENGDAALAGGAALGGIGAALGALIGLARHNWNAAHFEPGAAEPGIGVLPGVAAGGRFRVIASVRF